MHTSETSANIVLFGGSLVLTFLYRVLEFLNISPSQISVVVAICFFSAFVGLCRTLALGENTKVYVISDLLSKMLMIGVPLMFALGSKVIEALYYFVDYSFFVIVLGEILSVMINIQSIKSKKAIPQVDLYNIAVEKVKNFSSQILKTSSYIKEDQTSTKDNRNNKGDNNANQ